MKKVMIFPVFSLVALLSWWGATDFVYAQPILTETPCHWQDENLELSVLLCPTGQANITVLFENTTQFNSETHKNDCFCTWSAFGNSSCVGNWACLRVVLAGVPTGVPGPGGPNSDGDFEIDPENFRCEAFFTLDLCIGTCCTTQTIRKWCQKDCP